MQGSLRDPKALQHAGFLLIPALPKPLYGNHYNDVAPKPEVHKKWMAHFRSQSFQVLKQKCNECELCLQKRVSHWI